jgi:hypothetical protein
MDTFILPQNSTQEKLLFTLPHSGAMYLWCESKLWISISRLWPYLGTLHQGLAISACGTLRILNDEDGGVYVALDEFIQIMPADVQKHLRMMKRRLMKATAREGGAK